MINQLELFSLMNGKKKLRFYLDFILVSFIKKKTSSLHVGDPAPCEKQLRFHL